MYYDPTDYLDIPEIYKTLKESRPHRIKAVRNRIDYKQMGDSCEQERHKHYNIKLLQLIIIILYLLKNKKLHLFKQLFCYI